jgi:uncharacterized membrane protein
MKIITNIIRILFIIVGLYLVFGSFLFEKGDEKGNFIFLGIIFIIVGVILKVKKTIS